MYITLQTIKKHLNIDEDFTDDDSYLEHLYKVAEKVVERHIDDSLEELCEEVEVIPEDIPNEDISEDTPSNNEVSMLSEEETSTDEVEDKVVQKVLPYPLQQAILFYIGNLYQSRESVSFGSTGTEIPFTYDYLLSLYKNYKFW